MRSVSILQPVGDNLDVRLQTFQKLIFISDLVFGDQKAAFLLPWRRTFNLTDSQLAIAKRDSAKALFKSFLDERGGFQASCSAMKLVSKTCSIRADNDHH